MKRKLFCVLAVATYLAIGLEHPEANAQGFHLQTRGLHLDVGRPHGSYYGGHTSYYPSSWGGSYWGGGHGGGYWNRNHAWHDTTHLDYHPGEYVPHYNHYDYVPGHYDVHHTGHWDHLHH